MALPRMRRAVGAEEKARIAARHGLEQRLAVGFALEHRQAVVVRPHAALEQRIAIEQQVLRRDGRGDARAGGAHELDRGARSHVLEYHPQRGQRSTQRRQHVFDEARLAIENIDRRIGDLAMHLQHHAALAHALEHRIEPANVGDARFRMGGGAGRIELAADAPRRSPRPGRFPPAPSSR